MAKDIKVWDGSAWQGVGIAIPDVTSFATQSYVSNAISSLVNSAPSTLDTLKELATALNNDANYATTITTALGTKAPSANPTFTGTVSGITKTMVGLANVDNTSDANKPISTATQSALDLKAPLSSPTFTGIISVQSILENATIGSVVIDTAQFDYDLLSCGSIYYITANPTSNWVLNIRGNSSTTLNSLMSVNKSLTIAFAVTNGATAKYMTGIKIDGVSVTPKWQGGTAITSGNASAIDVYSITIIKTADNTYTALASQSKFA